jgi:hypothetical protein
MNVDEDKRKDGHSMKQVAEQLGIPYRHLRIVKVLFPDGFHKNNQVRVDKVKEYYEDNKDFIEEMESESLENLKKIEKANDILIQQFEIAEWKKQVIKVKEEKEFILKLGTVVSSVLLSKLVNELPEKLDATDKSKRKDLCKEIYNDVIKTFKEELKKRNV